MDRGFVGCEWWIQARETINPKEYHMVSLAVDLLYPRISHHTISPCSSYAINPISCLLSPMPLISSHLLVIVIQDTAITWCRDNGWEDQYLQNCHFYPTLGSVNYITDAGGPTGTCLLCLLPSPSFYLDCSVTHFLLLMLLLLLLC
jgi:hypothetical protein